MLNYGLIGLMALHTVIDNNKGETTMKKVRLNTVEINNAKYSKSEKVNNTSLWLAENMKNIKVGNNDYAAQCCMKAISSKPYI